MNINIIKFKNDNDKYSEKKILTEVYVNDYNSVKGEM